MSLFSGSKKMLIIGLLFFVLAGIFYFKFLSRSKPDNQTTKSPNPSATESNESPKVVSTKPDPLNDAVVSAADIIEISFNRPLENVGEFKSRIEPKIDYKVELSGDRKTARVIPAKPYQLGTTYTIFIGPDSKFDGVGEWKQDKTFHFRTITYRGV